MIFLPNELINTLLHKIFSPRFSKNSQKSSRISGQFSTFGYKKKRSIDLFFCILLRLETECTAQTEAAETIAPAII